MKDRMSCSLTTQRQRFLIYLSTGKLQRQVIANGAVANLPVTHIINADYGSNRALLVAEIEVTVDIRLIGRFRSGSVVSP